MSLKSTIETLDEEIAFVSKQLELSELLMKFEQFHKLGKEGALKAYNTAKDLGLNPFTSVGKDLICFRGNIELSAMTMNRLVRSNGHTITRDAKSNDKICTLHGKRADTGAEETASFSIEDAKKAGLGGGAWNKFTEDMLYARALSRLCRRLFADVIRGCYVEGEISSSPEMPKEVKIEKPETRKITPQEYLGLLTKLERNASYKQQILDYFTKEGKDLAEIDTKSYERILRKMETFNDEEPDVQEDAEDKDSGDVRTDSEPSAAA